MPLVVGRASSGGSATMSPAFCYCFTSSARPVAHYMTVLPTPSVASRFHYCLYPNAQAGASLCTAEVDVHGGRRLSLWLCSMQRLLHRLHSTVRTRPLGPCKAVVDQALSGYCRLSCSTAERPRHRVQPARQPSHSGLPGTQHLLQQMIR